MPRCRPGRKSGLQAYADGVNAFLDTHKNALPPEFLHRRRPPEPWKPANSLVWGKLMALQLSHNYEIEALRARLREKLGPEQAKWMFPGMKPGDPITTLPALNADACEPRSIEDEIGALTGIGRGASNEWVVSGSRTVTGKPILANDPHLGLGAPILWYLARIVTPEGSVKGATVPGTPVVLLGQNDRIAWGFTTADTDVQDLFVETVDPSDPSKYLTPDGPKPFETREETIRVKDAPDVKLTVRGDPARPGPLRRQQGARRRSPARARRSRSPSPGSATATRPERRSCASTSRATGATSSTPCASYQTPTQNIVYADVSGDIGFFSPGLVPLRKSGDGLAPVDGASGAFDWIGVVPFEQSAAAAQPGDRLRLQRQQRQCRGRPPADLRPGLGGDLPRPPHPAVLRHDRQAQSRDVGGHAGRPSVAGGQGIAAVHRDDRAVGRAGAAGSGDARRTGTR